MKYIIISLTLLLTSCASYKQEDKLYDHPVDQPDRHGFIIYEQGF